MNVLFSEKYDVKDVFFVTENNRSISFIWKGVGWYPLCKITHGVLEIVYHTLRPLYLPSLMI